MYKLFKAFTSLESNLLFFKRNPSFEKNVCNHYIFNLWRKINFKKSKLQNLHFQIKKTTFKNGFKSWEKP